jgi:hypothetical protein
VNEIPGSPLVHNDLAHGKEEMEMAMKERAFGLNGLRS